MDDPSLMHCYRCGWVWRPRGAEVRLCPRCKSRKWEVPELHVIRPGKGLGVRDLKPDQRSTILEICERHGARNVRVFGSFARQQATPKSDLDLLVALDPGTSLFDQASLEIDLEEVLGRKVDVVPERGLRWTIRPQVLFEAVPL